MTAVASVPYLLRRGDHFSFRRVVPRRLTSRLGRREIKVALATVDLSVARRRARLMANDFEEVLEMVAKNDHLTVAQIDELLRRYLAREWAAVEGYALDPELVPEQEAEQAEEGVEELTRRIRDNRFNRITCWEAQGALGGRLPPEGSLEHRYALAGLLRAQREAARLSVHAFRGEHVLPADPLFTGVRPSFAEPVAEGPEMITVLEALRGWAKAEKRPYKTLHEWDTAVTRFVELHGNLPVDQIKARHVREFRDAMASFPRHRNKKLQNMKVRSVLRAVGRDPAIPRLTPATINKQLVALKSVLAWAIEEDHLERNPATGIKVRGSAKATRPRVPWSLDQLASLFSGPVHAEGERPKGGAGEAAYWLPVLGLYTGGRLGELGQLRVSDVRKEASIDFLDINVSGDKSLKTDNSRRRVPIHPELVRLGFLEYVQKTREGGPEAPLFPHLRSDTHGVLTGLFSKWWGRYSKSLVPVIDGTRHDFHALRHGFKDRLRECEAPEDIRDALAGHTNGNVGRSYGSGHSLNSLNKWMLRLEYPGVEIKPWQL